MKNEVETNPALLDIPLFSQMGDAELVLRVFALRHVEKYRVCGVVDETYKSGTIVVATVTGKFSVGATIYLRSKNQCTEFSIQSIQLDGENQEAIELSDAAQLGMGLDGRARVLQQVLQFGHDDSPARG